MKRIYHIALILTCLSIFSPNTWAKAESSESNHPIPVPKTLQHLSRWDLIWYMSNKISQQEAIGNLNQAKRAELINKGTGYSEAKSAEDFHRISKKRTEENARLNKISKENRSKLNKLEEYLRYYISACNESDAEIKTNPYSVYNEQRGSIFPIFPDNWNLKEIEIYLKKESKKANNRNHNELRALRISIKSNPLDDEATKKDKLKMSRLVELSLSLSERVVNTLSQYVRNPAHLKSKYLSQDEPDQPEKYTDLDRIVILFISLDPHYTNTIQFPATPNHKLALTKLTIMRYGVGCTYDQNSKSWSLVIQKPGVMDLEIIPCDNIQDQLVKYAESINFNPKNMEFPFE